MGDAALATLGESYLYDIGRLVDEGDLALAVDRALDFARDFAPSRRRALIDHKKDIVFRGQFAGREKTSQADAGARAATLIELVETIAAEAGLSAHAVGALRNAGHSGVPDIEEARAAYWRSERNRRREAGLSTRAASGHALERGYKGSAFRLGPVSFEAEIGQVIGLVGINASGKTTLLNIIAGDLAAEKGRIAYPALSADRLSWPLIRSQIDYVPAESWGLTGEVRDTIETALALAETKDEVNREEADYLLLRYGLMPHQSKDITNLSSGYKLRYELARALSSAPKILILDEPLANLDIISQQALLADLRSIARSVPTPTCIFITSHHVAEVEAVVDQIIVLDDGACLHAGELAAIGAAASGSLFEVGVRGPRAEAAQILAGLGPVRIRRNAATLLAQYEEHVAAAVVLSALLERSVTVQSFQDLTNSARQLFNR